MKITPLKEIGKNRPLCTKTIRVAAGLKTTAAQYGAAERRRKRIPIDQCGRRGDYHVNGEPRCSAHAGQEALAYILTTKAPSRPVYRTMETAPHDRDVLLLLPNADELRAVWWANWVDPDATEEPWAWRSFLIDTDGRASNVMGAPVRAAVGWREVED